METNFTSGKWKVDSGRTPLGETGDYMPYVLVIGEGLPVAMLSEHFEDDTTEANAKLMAASPDLLKACNFALQSIKSGNADELTVRVLEDAISKALS